MNTEKYMEKGLVSIVIPTYNRKHSIGDAIDSCLVQSYQSIEIIVCDDHSTDGTKDYIAKRMKEDSRIHYCTTPEGKKGANAARNAAIKIARGEFLTFLDSDDYLTNDSIACRVELFQKNHVAMVYGNAFCEIGKKRTKWIYTNLSGEKVSQKKYLMQELSLCCFITIMIRTSVFKVIGLLDEKQTAWQDDRLVVTVGMRYPILHSRRFVAVARKSEVSITSDKWNTYLGLKTMVTRYKWQIIKYASLGRYFLWQIRLFSLYCFAKEREVPINSKQRNFWQTAHQFTKELIYPFFRNYFE